MATILAYIYMICVPNTHTYLDYEKKFEACLFVRAVFRSSLLFFLSFELLFQFSSWSSSRTYLTLIQIQTHTFTTPMHFIIYIGRNRFYLRIRLTFAATSKVMECYNGAHSITCYLNRYYIVEDEWVREKKRVRIGGKNLVLLFCCCCCYYYCVCTWSKSHFY